MKHLTSRLLAYAFTFLVMILVNSCTPENQVLVSLVTFHIGDVKIISSGNPPRPVVLQDPIAENDTIITGKDAEAVVQMGDNIVVNILAESKVTFVSMMESAKIELKLDSGKILNKLGKLKAQREFLITTKTATASVRGTTFLVFYDRKAATVAVGEGAVEVKKVTATPAKEAEKKEGKEVIGKKVEAIIVAKNKTVVISEEPKASPVSRPISEVETFYIQKILNQPVIPKPARATRTEIEKIEEEAKPKIKQIDNRINEFYPQSLKKISENYDRIDVIKLYSGKTYEGIIVSRGEKVIIMSTPQGRIEIPINKVKYTGIKK